MNHLERIDRIVGQDFVGDVATFEGLSSQFVMNRGASVEQIERSDARLFGRIPTAYKEFLRIYDGGVLFRIEDFAGFKFLGTDELVKENASQKQSFGSDWDEKILLFCVCIGDGEFMAFRASGRPDRELVFCIMDENPTTWFSIGDSFEAFVEKLIEGRGRKYWLEDS